MKKTKTEAGGVRPNSGPKPKNYLDKKSPIQITIYQTNAEKLVLNANLEKFNEAKSTSVQFFKEKVENILKINS